MLKITKNIDEANLITHASKFHADEVFATALLSKIYPNSTICRVNEVPSNISDEKIVYDIGFGIYDHHMKDFDLRHDSGVKYASFGLIFKEFGIKYLETIDKENALAAYTMIEHDLVEGVDAVDNGEFPIVTAPYNYKGIESLINDYNACWDDDTDNDLYFLQVVDIISSYFDRVVLHTLAKIKAKKYVDEAIINSSDYIMILDKYMPFKDIVITSELEQAKDILFAITPSNRGGYNIHTIPRDKSTHETRMDFPKEWGGLVDKELQKVSGVETAVFCHKELFLAVASTKEDALKMAKIAILNGEIDK
ncbi:MAG: MYG1 family protein [Bacilli bacterium]|nr:MYG1 family protein [Bacilli bacterium]